MKPVHDQNKALLGPLRRVLRSCDPQEVRSALFDVFAQDAKIRLQYPFGDIEGPEALWSTVYAPLFNAMPDLERRDFIVMAGPRWRGTGNWVGLGGNFLGTLHAPWLGIPATGTPVHMRYHEYLRIEEGQVIEMQGLWDIPQVMVQAEVWPLGPQAGTEWLCPGPFDGQGILTAPHDADRAHASVGRVWDMLHDLQQGTKDTPGRGLGGFWHNHANWYGPTGLGSARGHDGIARRIFKQFRDGLSNNTRHLDQGVFFGDGDFVAFTGWPSGTAQHTGEGFLGLAPTGKTITRASLDFWRLDQGLVRECWVMIDMLDLYRQLGVDVLAQMRQGQQAA